jgi:hypothetical protein
MLSACSSPPKRSVFSFLRLDHSFPPVLPSSRPRSRPRPRSVSADPNFVQGATAFAQRTFPVLANYPPERIEFLVLRDVPDVHSTSKSWVSVSDEAWPSFLNDPPARIRVQIVDGPGDAENRTSSRIATPSILRGTRLRVLICCYCRQEIQRLHDHPFLDCVARHRSRRVWGSDAPRTLSQGQRDRVRRRWGPSLDL